MVQDLPNGSRDSPGAALTVVSGNDSGVNGKLTVGISKW